MEDLRVVRCRSPVQLRTDLFRQPVNCGWWVRRQKTVANSLGISSKSMYIGRRPFWPGFSTWAGQSRLRALNLTDDDFVFSHTKIIVRRSDGELLYTKPCSRSRSIDTEINGLEIHHIPAKDIWPVANPKLTRAPNPLPGNVYLKRPKLIQYGEDNSGPLDYGKLILDEVDVCETLRKIPHPNIAQYLGCVVEDNRVKGLGFVKGDIIVSQMLRQRLLFKRSHCLDGFTAGMEHLHRLGLVHNDLNPIKHHDDGEYPCNYRL